VPLTREYLQGVAEPAPGSGAATSHTDYLCMPAPAAAAQAVAQVVEVVQGHSFAPAGCERMDRAAGAVAVVAESARELRHGPSRLRPSPPGGGVDQDRLTRLVYMDISRPQIAVDQRRSLFRDKLGKFAGYCLDQGELRRTQQSAV